LPYLGQEGHDLVLWKDPKKTGIVVGFFTTVFAFFYFTSLPLLSIGAYGVALAVAGCALWARCGRSVGKPMPPPPAVLREGISDADFKAHCDGLKPFVDRAVAVVHDLVICKNVKLSLQVAGAFFVLGKVSSFVSIFVLSFFGFVALFALPKVYEQNKSQVDEAVGKANNEFNKVYAKVKEEGGKVINKIPTSAKKSE